MPPLRLRHLGLLVPAAAALAAGCSSGPKNFENDNDALRRQVLQMDQEITSLRAQRAELAAKLSELNRALNAQSSGLTNDALEALPRCAELQIGALSGPVDSDSIPGLDAFDLYISPLDGLRRFTQITGSLTATVSLLPTPDNNNSQSQPSLLASASLGPAELRDAYRSSFMGTHYSLRLPLHQPNQPLPPHGVLASTITFDDALTGARLTATATRELPTPSDPPAPPR